MTRETNTAVAIKGSVTNAEERATRVGQGSENVRAADMAIPRIKLLQALSPEVQKGSAQYVEGAEPGLMMNSLSEELFNATFVINLHYDRKVVVWKKRKFGGGMFGAFETEGEAQAALQEAGENEAQFDIVDNPTHLVLLLSEEGTPKGVALLDMPGVKAKVSRRWNTLIAEQEKEGNPRFGCVWELKAIQESNQHGPFANFDLDFVVVAPDEIYDAAQAAFDAFFGGQREAA